MTTEELLLGPLLLRRKITTVTGPPGEEMATLAASIAVSYRTGVEIVPGWPPAGPGVVTVIDYVATRIEWDALVRDICDDAQIAVPPIDIGFPEYLWRQQPPVERDPDADAFWDASDKADAAAVAVEARETGRPLQPRLLIINGAHAAAPSDALQHRLYAALAGQTVLVMSAPTAFTTEAWGADELRASDFGPVLRLEDIHDLMMASSANGIGVGRAVDHSVVASVVAHAAATAAAPSDEVELLPVADEAPISEAPSSGPGVLFGYAVVWDEWSEIDRLSEGNFLMRYVAGAFARTIRERWPGRTVYFCHGKDPRFGKAALGPIIKLVEDAHGLYYEVELHDTALNRELAAGLRAGLYDGSSTMSRSITTVLDSNPGKSAWNPKGLPEETVTEARLQEFGPVREPQFKGTSTGIRPPVALSGEPPQMLEEARAFFAVEGAEAMTAFLRDGHSVESQKLRRRARAEGITPGQLWKAATRLEREATEGLR